MKMNLLDIIKNWFKKPAAHVILEEVEEAPRVSCGELFVQVCADYGIGKTLLERLSAIEKFEQWYDGPCDKESVRAAISDFKQTDVAIKAKIDSYAKGEL